MSRGRARHDWPRVHLALDSTTELLPFPLLLPGPSPIELLGFGLVGIAGAAAQFEPATGAAHLLEVHAVLGAHGAKEPRDNRDGFEPRPFLF